AALRGGLRRPRGRGRVPAAGERGRRARHRGLREHPVGPRIYLALNRGDLAALSALLEKPVFVRRQIWFYAATVTSYLDGLAAMRDVDRIEADAPQFLQPPSALEP